MGQRRRVRTPPAPRIKPPFRGEQCREVLQECQILVEQNHRTAEGGSPLGPQVGQDQGITRIAVGANPGSRVSIRGRVHRAAVIGSAIHQLRRSRKNGETEVGPTVRIIEMTVKYAKMLSENDNDKDGDNIHRKSGANTGRTGTGTDREATGTPVVGEIKADTEDSGRDENNFKRLGVGRGRGRSVG